MTCIDIKPCLEWPSSDNFYLANPWLEDIHGSDSCFTVPSRFRPRFSRFRQVFSRFQPGLSRFRPASFLLACPEWALPDESELQPNMQQGREGPNWSQDGPNTKRFREPKPVTFLGGNHPGYLL